MRLRFFTAAVALCLAGGDLLAQRQVQLRATVVNPNGEPVNTIDPKDVRVTENDMPATTVKAEGFNHVSKVQVLIDNGLGMPKESIGDLRKGLSGLLEAIPAKVETTVVTTAPQPRFIERGTADRSRLMKAVELVAPDSGAGRFVESLEEATARIAKDRDSFHSIVTVGTAAGDLDVREADIKRIMDRAAEGRFRVFAVLLVGPLGTTASGGDVQERMGALAAGNTGGRFEKINIASRLATLLPEIGAEIAKSAGPSSRQFRFTVNRPAGMSGDLGRLRISIGGGLLVSNVTAETMKER